MMQPLSSSPTVYRYFSARARARAARNLSMATWTSGVKSVGNMMAMTTWMQWAMSCRKSTILWELVLCASIKYHQCCFLKIPYQAHLCLTSQSLGKKLLTIAKRRTLQKYPEISVFSHVFMVFCWRLMNYCDPRKLKQWKLWLGFRQQNTRRAESAQSTGDRSACCDITKGWFLALYVLACIFWEMVDDGLFWLLTALRHIITNNIDQLVNFAQYGTLINCDLIKMLEIYSMLHLEAKSL